MTNPAPFLYFILLILIMWIIFLMVRMSELAGKIKDLKDRIHIRKGEPLEEEPEWI